MRILLDTNIFVYMATDEDSLSHDVRELLNDYDNQLCISAESLRELIVAYSTKNLWKKQWNNEAEMIDSIENEFFVTILPVGKEHMQTFARLEPNEAQGHKDPSDHVIISHAITEKLTLVSSDRKFPFYEKQGLQLIRNEK